MKNLCKHSEDMDNCTRPKKRKSEYTKMIVVHNKKSDSTWPKILLEDTEKMRILGAK